MRGVHNFSLITVIHATSSCIRLHSALLIYSISFADKIDASMLLYFASAKNHSKKRRPVVRESTTATAHVSISRSVQPQPAVSSAHQAM